ncbi:MAG: hypothetical protein WBC89_09015 [Dehalococcoidia bacterium]
MHRGADYDSPASVQENAWAVVLDGSGNIYVTGESDGSSTSLDYAIRANSQTDANTPVGSDVTVLLSDAVVNFATVVAEGTTTVVWSADNPAGLTPPNSCASGLFIDIITTATYGSNVTIGIRYNEPTSPNENDLRLFHWTGTDWEDATIWMDTANNIVYGEVSSLSWFFIGGQWVWKEDPVPVLAPIVAGGLFLFETLSDVWVVDSVQAFSSNCTMDETVVLEVTDCGNELWPIIEWIMMDSIISWKYWLPPLVDVVGALSFTYVTPG